MRTQNRLGLLKFLLVTLAAGLLSGCATSFAPSPVSDMQVPIGNIQGNVHGGNLPISGADIYLYQASKTGYGTAATSLICNATVDTKPCPTAGTYGPFKDAKGNYYVVTDANGNFALGGDYMCTVNSQVYMVAVGGNPGLGGTVNNSAIVQMTGLGNCPAAGNTAATVPWLVINEVTTVGFAYAMGGFATTPYNVSADAGGAVALANAMSNFENIVNVGNGLANGPTMPGLPNSVSPRLKINALANILSTCVNQTGPTAGYCPTLFKYATTTTGGVPADEGAAIFNIVHNQALLNSLTASTQTQAQNVSNLYALVTMNQPFLPFLGSTPIDWTMPVIYTGVISKPVTASNTITSGPYNIAFDAGGNAWIGDRINGVIEIGAEGAVTTFSNSTYGFKEVKGVAISPQDGTIWISDFGNNDVVVMNPAGTKPFTATITQHMTSNGPVSTVFALNPIPTTPAGDYMAYEVDETVPGLVTIDAGTYVPTHYTGNANGGTSYSDVTLPGWTYVDSTGVVWIPSTNTEYAGELIDEDKNGSQAWGATDLYMGATYTTVPEQLGMAADGLQNVWAATNINGFPTELYELKGGALQTSVAGGGLSNPYKTFVDGSNSIWVANGGANTVSGYNTTTTPAAWMSGVGFSTNAASGTGCVVMAVDPSGNVWTGNADQSVSELLGLGTPTAAPLSGGRTVATTGPTTTTYTNGNLGTKP